MSNLAYTRPLGVWNIGVIRAAELADLDAKTVKAPNFDGGGTYAPSSVITVGGSGMTIRMVGTSTVVDLISFQSGAGLQLQSGAVAGFYGASIYSSSSTTSVSNGGTWTFNAGSILNVDGHATFTGPFSAVGITVSSIQVSDSLYTAPGSVANLNGTLHVAQGATFSDVATFNSDVNVAGGTNMRAAFTDDLTVGGPMEVGGIAQFDQPVVFDGVGRVRRRAAILSGSGSGTISATVATNYLAQGLTGNLTVQIDDSGTDDGDEIYVFNPDPTHIVFIRNPGGTTLGGVVSAVNNFESMTFQRIGGSWYIIGRSGIN